MASLFRRPRQIVAYTVGDRSQQGGLSLRAQLPAGDRRRATRRDFWLAYAGAFPARTHRFCGKRKGGTNHVIKQATVLKHCRRRRKSNSALRSMMRISWLSELVRRSIRDLKESDFHGTFSP